MRSERRPRSRHLDRFVGVLLVGVSGAELPAQAPKQITTPTVVSSGWLAVHGRDQNVVLVSVEHEVVPGLQRIPGAVAVSYRDLVETHGAVGTELPPPERVRSLLEASGVSDTTLVVVYSREVLMATRALFTFSAIGHQRVALLDGGMSTWLREGRPVTRTPLARRPRGHLTARSVNDVVVDAAWVRTHLENPGVSFVDTRTDAEYEGRATRPAIPSAGHLPGAGQIQWQELFADSLRLTLRPRSELRRLFAARTNPRDMIVTYCGDGYRASATWFVARWLGLPARLYDGSYQDWHQRGLPLRRDLWP